MQGEREPNRLRFWHKVLSSMAYKRLLIFISIAGILVAGIYFFYPDVRKKDVQDFLTTEMRKCGILARHNQSACWQKLAASTLEKFSFTETQQALASSGQYCHGFLHAISRHEYEETQDAAKLFSQCTLTCFAACYHGGAEGYLRAVFEKGGGEAEIHQAILDVCDRMPNDAPGALRSECIHGIGHALMFVTGGDLPKSLTLCDTLTKIESVICYGGAFMENLPNLTAREHPPLFVKADDPLYPCNSPVIKDHQRERCYSFHGSYFIYISDSDWQKASLLCLKVPAEYQGGCFWYMGLSALRGSELVMPQGTGSAYNNKLLGTVRDLCDIVPLGEARTQCIKGVIWSFGIRYGGDVPRLKVMLDFCPLVGSEYKDSCYQTAGSVLVYFMPHEKQRENICNEIAESAGRETCFAASQASFRDVATRKLQ